VQPLLLSTSSPLHPIILCNTSFFLNPPHPHKNTPIRFDATLVKSDAQPKIKIFCIFCFFFVMSLRPSLPFKLQRLSKVLHAMLTNAKKRALEVHPIALQPSRHST
jgi:hypothetical protein